MFDVKLARDESDSTLARIPRAATPLFATDAGSIASDLHERVGRPQPLGEPLRARCLLIIDDDEATRYAIGSFALRPGTRVIEAENGLRGIEIAQRERPDLILLDLMMPGIGGHEVLQRLKTDPSTSDIPVIVVTSRFVNDEEKAQILSRAAAVIYKGDLARDIVTGTIDRALE